MHYLQYWTPDTADATLEYGGPVDWTASEQLGRLREGAGHIVWVVTVYEGRLTLVGRVRVDEVLARAEMARRLPEDELWEAKWFAVAAPGTAEPARKVDLTPIAGELRFRSKDRPRLDVNADGRVNPQQLQTMRVLEDASAELLERAWRATPTSMPAPARAPDLQKVETVQDVRRNIAEFNHEASANLDRARNVLSHTTYWVLDEESGAFGPGKFVGLTGMTFPLYERCRVDERGGHKPRFFDGTHTQQALAQVVGGFRASDQLADRLEAWGRRLVGGDPFARVKHKGKWQFTVLHARATSGGTRTSAKRNPPWTRDELILAFDLYFRAGRRWLDEKDPQVIELSAVLNRLNLHAERPDAKTFRNATGVSMKLGNFLHVDPEYPGKGLNAGNKLDKVVFEEFASDPDRLHEAAEAIRAFLADGRQPAPPPAEWEGEEAPEGRLLMRQHKMRERNPGLVRKKKAQALAQHGCLRCEVCGFVYAERYGPHGEGFIECHHRTPLAELRPGQVTRLIDLALVCANCHRMLHWRGSQVTVERLHTLLAQEQHGQSQLMAMRGSEAGTGIVRNRAR